MFPQEAVQRALKLDPCPDRLTTLAALAKEMESGCMGHKKNLPAMLSSPPTPIRFLQKEEIILGQGADFLDQASSNEKHSPPQSIHSQRLGPILFPPERSRLEWPASRIKAGRSSSHTPGKVCTER